MPANRRRIFATIGMIGVVIIAVACIVTALAFVGVQGERYSPFTHFISDLGFVGVSQWAAIFNIGLIIAAPCVGIFLMALAWSLNGWRRYPFAVISLIAGIAGMLVGIIPKNDLRIHLQVAQTFFLTGGVVVALFSLHIWFGKQTAYPRWITIIGILSVISFAAFLSIVLPGGAGAMAALEDQPHTFSMTVVWEWLILITLLLWIFVVALYYGKAQNDQDFSLTPALT